MDRSVFGFGGIVLLMSAISVGAQDVDSLEFVRFEQVWNDAHLRGDTVALADLWADRLLIEVPEMPAMSKTEALAFWRLGRSNITRYETSGIRVQIDGDSVLVRGHLLRQRDFNGRVVEDNWAFLKVYRRFGERWRVIVFRASDASRSTRQQAHARIAEAPRSRLDCGSAF